jgi:hypothetical protein
MDHTRILAVMLVVVQLMTYHLYLVKAVVQGLRLLILLLLLLRMALLLMHVLLLVVLWLDQPRVPGLPLGHLVRLNQRLQEDRLGCLTTVLDEVGLRAIQGLLDGVVPDLWGRDLHKGPTIQISHLHIALILIQGICSRVIIQSRIPGYRILWQNLSKLGHDQQVLVGLRVLGSALEAPTSGYA